MMIPSIMNVRYWTSVGLMLRLMFRSDVPVRSAPNRRAAAAVPPAVFRPSSATASPKKPTCEVWMSLVKRLNFQPRMSSAAAQPANAPETSITRIHVRPALIPA
jgi:hypothetical protein